MDELLSTGCKRRSRWRADCGLAGLGASVSAITGREALLRASTALAGLIAAVLLLSSVPVEAAREEPIMPRRGEEADAVVALAAFDRPPACISPTGG